MRCNINSETVNITLSKLSYYSVRLKIRSDLIP